MNHHNKLILRIICFFLHCNKEKIRKIRKNYKFVYNNFKNRMKRMNYNKKCLKNNKNSKFSHNFKDNKRKFRIRN